MPEWTAAPRSPTNCPTNTFSLSISSAIRILLCKCECDFFDSSFSDALLRAFLRCRSLRLAAGSDQCCFLSWLTCFTGMREYRLLNLAGVVVRIDVVELKWRLTVDLHNGFSGSHSIVVHVRVEESKAPGNERFHLAGVKFIAHADFERPGNDRDVFPVRVTMGRDTEPIRHLQTNREVAGRGRWVAFEYGKLRTRTHNGRCRPPGNRIRGECVFFVRLLMRGAGEHQPHPREYSSHCKS